MPEFDLATHMDNLISLGSEWGLRVLGALAVLILGRWVSKRLRRITREALGRTGMEPMLIPFTASMVYWGIMAFVGIAVLGLFGVPTASFVAVIGAAGLAVGLALQGTLANFASGVMILTFRPFVVGHVVEIGGTVGTVAEVGLFSTDLNTFDNIRVTIPNSQIYGQTIKNYHANQTRRVDMIVGVSYGDDLEVARNTILEILQSDPRVLSEPEPVVAVSELGDSSVNLVVRPWCDRTEYVALKFDLTGRFKVELENAGCSIPFPQRDVHLHEVA